MPMLMVICSMACVQVGGALSVPLFDTLGVAGTTWLRLTCASVVLLIGFRPARLTLAQVRPAVVLGLLMAVQSILFASASHRIPLGVTVAVEFCGPLTLAAMTARGHLRQRLMWPAVALAGVVLLTEPWSLGDGSQATLGLLFAVGAAICWAGYILLMTSVGKSIEGVGGLAVALPVASLMLAPFGVGQVLGAMPNWSALAVCALAGLLAPFGSFTLEMIALRSMPTPVFGVWMSLEPAFGALAGLAVLHQVIGGWQLPGFVLVVLAGVFTQRLSSRAATDQSVARAARRFRVSSRPHDGAASGALTNSGPPCR